MRWTTLAPMALAAMARRALPKPRFYMSNGSVVERPRAAVLTLKPEELGKELERTNTLSFSFTCEDTLGTVGGQRRPRDLRGMTAENYF